MKSMSGGSSEVDEKLAALMINANAIQAIAAAVEGTMGPKGLDTMLVDRFGEVIITNAGVTILEKMDVNHPAAKMLINVAKAQQAEIGDGTTTATIMAGALIAEGVGQVVRGVPVARVIEGMKVGVRCAAESVVRRSRSIESLDDPILSRIAYVSGREHEDIASLVVGAARLIGKEKLMDKSFKLAETILAEEGADNEVFMGVIIGKERLSKQMPKNIHGVKILVVDDALEPEEIEDEALATELGFKKYMELQAEFKENIQKIIDLGVNLCLVDRGIDDIAEEMLTDAEIMAVCRVSSGDLRKIVDHTGARALKRTTLRKDLAELERYVGVAEQAFEDERLGHVRVIGGAGKPMATILVGAATAEVVGERERIAKDAASSVQAAVRGGYVPGGGAIEVAVAKDVEGVRQTMKGMSAYGVDCVSAALKRPLSQIVLNAGFNPLEKVEDVIAAQISQGLDTLAVNCDSGEVMDMLVLGVVDPTLVKVYAIRAAGEIAEAILRIDTIIRKRDEEKASERQPDF
ncbi:MAG: TCP-1/cpn60 chaperonin family protein [Peptococcaceae bacterium]|nr:TCP-1/cpn60 chaperonin family protein [Peptococcaceae bacterium]